VIRGDESDIDLFDLSTRRRCGALNRVSSLAFRIASPLYLIEVARASGRRYLAYREGQFQKLSPLRNSTIMA